MADGRILVASYYKLWLFHPDGTAAWSGPVDGNGITYGTAIQRIDGKDKIITVGHVAEETPLVPPSPDSVYHLPGFSPGRPRLAVHRYNLDGSLDTDFGNRGVALGGFDRFSFGQDVTVQSDGKIVAVGSVADGAMDDQTFAVARFTADGKPDEDFNRCGPTAPPPCGGMAQTDISPDKRWYVPFCCGSVESVAIQRVNDDDKILLAGTAETDKGVGFSLIRYNSDGTLDEAFNRCGEQVKLPCGGKATGPTPADFPADDEGNIVQEAQLMRIAVQPHDGRIVGVGLGAKPGRRSDMLIARYNPDGTLEGCGSPGTERVEEFVGSLALGVAIQPADGRIVTAGGYAEKGVDGESGTLLMRYMGNGGPTGCGLSIADAAPVNEPGAGSFPAAFTVTMSRAPLDRGPVTVDYTTVDGVGAKAGSDYTTTSDTLVFGPDETTKTIMVPVLADDDVDGTENFTVKLFNAIGAVVYRDEGLGTIKDSTVVKIPPPTISVGDAPAVVDPPEGDTATAVFPLTLSRAMSEQVSVRFTTVDDSAKAGVDYTAASDRATFAPGATTTEVRVPVVHNATPNGSVRFYLDLSDPVLATVSGPSRAASYTNPAAIVIPSPDVPVGCPPVCPATTATPYPSPIEVTGTTGTISDVNVTLSGLTHDSPSDLDVMLQAPDGTTVMLMSDVCGSDGDNPITTPVALTFDDQAPGSLPANHRCNPGTYKPFDDDKDPDFPFTPEDSFSLPAPPTSLNTSLSALKGLDPNGSWKLWVVDDFPTTPGRPTGQFAGGWSLDLTVSGSATTPPPPPPTLVDRRGEAFVNDPPYPTVDVADPPAVVVEPGPAGRATALFRLRLSAPSTQRVEVPYATAAVSATEGVDYAAKSETVVFAPGETTKTVEVSVLHDDEGGEPRESFELRVGALRGAILGRNPATALIDDPPSSPRPHIVVSDAGEVSEPLFGSPPSPAAFVIALLAETDHPVSVRYRTVAGTATATDDFTSVSGTADFGTGDTTFLVEVPVLGDEVSPEEPETFTLVLSEATGADVVDDSGLATIVDTPPDEPTYAYECAVTGVTATAATLGASTADPGIDAATLTLRRGDEVVSSKIVAPPPSPPRSATWSPAPTTS